MCRYWIYIISLLVFIGSIVTGVVVPADSIIRQLAAVPAIGALFAAIVQVFRDQVAFDRQLILSHQQQAFSLGAASHMASRAFDKHAEFCEQYMVEVDRTVDTLFREGPTPEAMGHAIKLAELKNNYSAWLTKDIINNLNNFEKAIRKIGADSYLSKALSGTNDPERPKVVARMFAIFRELLSIDDDQEERTKNQEWSIEKLKDYLRSMLGIEQLTSIRQRLIKQALDAVPENKR